MKTVKLVILMVAVALPVLWASPFLAAPFLARRARITLLTKTDFGVLLGAGRDVLVQVHLEPNPGPDGLHHSGTLPIPNGVQIPKAIRDLNPHRVAVNLDGYLVIEMHGGMEHFGLFIYPDGFKAPSAGVFQYRDHRLLDGLWYYDEEYLYAKDKRFAARIQALAAKNKTSLDYEGLKGRK